MIMLHFIFSQKVIFPNQGLIWHVCCHFIPNLDRSHLVFDFFHTKFYDPIRMVPLDLLQLATKCTKNRNEVWKKQFDWLLICNVAANVPDISAPDPQKPTIICQVWYWKQASLDLDQKGTSIFYSVIYFFFSEFVTDKYSSATERLIIQAINSKCTDLRSYFKTKYNTV